MADRIAEFGSDSASVTLTILTFSLGAEGVRDNLRNLLRSGNNVRSVWMLSANAEKLDEHLRSEGLRYVPKFFATAIIGENPSVFDLQIKPLSSYVEIPHWRPVTVESRVHRTRHPEAQRAVSA